MEKERLLDQPDGYLKVLDRYDIDYDENPAIDISEYDDVLWDDSGE